MSIQITDRVYKRNPYQISSYQDLIKINPDFKRDDYIIRSWNTQPDGSGITISPDEILQISSDNTLYAQWEEKDITFTTTAGTVEKFHISELSNETVPANTLQYRQKSTYSYSTLSVVKPYIDNKNLSSSIIGEQNINTIISVDDTNGHIKTIGNGSFYLCPSITALNLPNLETINSNAFYRCYGITSLNLPELNYLPSSALNRLMELVYINCPKLMHIDDCGFEQNHKLSVVDFSEKTDDEIPIIHGAGAFLGCNNYYIIKVPDRLYKTWIASNKWWEVKSHISSVTQPIVTFLSGDTIVKQQKINYNMSADAPIVSRPYYDFKGWDNDYNDVSTDITCNAIFSKRFLNDDTTVLEMENHYVTGPSADFIHTCDEINPNVSCTIDGVTILLNNTEDYNLSYKNNTINWTNLNIGDLCSQVAQVIVTGKGYYEGQVSTDFTITYYRNGADKVTVTFDPCGGDVQSEPQDILYSIGDTYGLCSEFNNLDTIASRVGYEFLGWFDEGSESRVLSTDTITKSTPYTLSAHWQIKKFGLSAYSSPSEYGTINNENPFISNDIERGTIINLSAIPAYGREFVKWSDNDVVSSKTIIVNSNIDISAHFRTISTDINIQSYPSMGGLTYCDKDLIGYNESVNISAVPNDGYDFSNWSKVQGMCVIEDNTLSITTISSYNTVGSLILNANFTPKTYNVILHKDGGTCTDLTSYVYKIGATLPTNWSKEGYEFDGWYDNSELTGNAVTTITTTDIGDKEFWVKSFSYGNIHYLENEPFTKIITPNGYVLIDSYDNELIVGE